MGKKAVIFDLDGTLLNSIDDIADSVNKALEMIGFKGHTPEVYKTFVGDGIRELVRRALPESHRTIEFISNCLENARKSYEELWDHKTRPYPGIPQMLAEMEKQGIKMAVLSNKPDRFTKMAVHKFLGTGKFEVVFGERENVPRKPDPFAAKEIAEIFRIDPENFMYVGDSGTDMKTAVSAGMYPVGVTWGFRDKKELLEYGAQAIIYNPMELLSIIET